MLKKKATVSNKDVKTLWSNLKSYDRQNTNNQSDLHYSSNTNEKGCCKSSG